MEQEIGHRSLAATTRDLNDACQDVANCTGALVKDGRLVVWHPPEGPYPVVIPCPGIRLVVNDQERNQPSLVTSEDTVEIATVDERKAGKWSITVSSDGLQARLRICPTVVIHRELTDLPAAKKLQLVVAEKEECIPPLTWNELLQELSRLGINYGVDWEACARAATSCAAEEVVIAWGIPGGPGKDGRVEVLFSASAKIPLLLKEDERVDFRKRYVFTAVEAGEILAVKHPPELGHPGTSVKGDVIVPPPPQDFILAAAEGAVLTKDADRAVATRGGRPAVFRRGNLVRVGVLPELLHTGDVDIASGNIVFKGDVVIGGNVNEGMMLEAGGNIKLAGLVSGARVQAAGSILIRGNILSSVVAAGGTPAFLQKLLPQVQVLAEGLQGMTLAIRQLLGHPAFKQDDLKRGIGPLVKLLLEGKFSHLPTAVNTFKKQVETMSLELPEEGLEEFIRDAERIVGHSSLAVRDLGEVETLAQQVAELKQSLVTPLATESDVVASSILNSTIIASGNVRIVGGGCYNSRIQAGKKVTISGVFRGGEIEAGEDVHLREIGSRGGSAAMVVAGPAAVVTVEYAFENVSVLVGGRLYRFDREEKGICLWLDQDGNLQSRAVPA